MDSLTSESIERNGNDAEAQRVARAAIMEMPAFPELERRLISVLGPTSEAIMIHQLVYWFSKRKMQNRWSAYKTYKEWKDERGLNRKQVDKGRKRLNANKLVEEKYGNYKRIEYQVDWVKLAELLLIPLKGGQSYDLDDLKDDDFDVLGEEPLYPLKGGQSSSDIPKGGTVQNDTPLMDDSPDTYAENSTFGGVQSNARDYTVAYEQDNPTLQVGAEPAFAEPAPLLINKDKEPKEGLAPPKPDDDTLLAEVKEILEPDSGRWSYACYIKNDYPPEKVAGYIITNAEDIKRPEVVTSVPRDELEQAVGYVQWEAVA
jgi:hypothetical protein